MNINVLNAPISELGEGIYLDRESCRLYWVDINKSILYQYDIEANQLVNTFKLVGNPSCIFSVSDESLVYADRIGIKRLNLKDETVSALSTHPLHNAELFRANDGTLLSDGSLLYGTMSFSPENESGKIYCVDSNGNVLSYKLGIHIPNTFIYADNNLFISDSLKQYVYILDLTNFKEGNVSLKVWKDFSKFDYTPDGGCISKKGFIHIALWNGAAIIVLDQNGKLMRLIELPVLKPTNCEIHNNRWLYVTSAREGMTPAQLKQYPLSGNTLVVDLGNNYEY